MSATREALTHALRALVLLALGVLALAGCSHSPTAVPAEPDPPTVAAVAAADVPAFDTDLYKVTCQTASGACPVVRWDGVDYVALSYRDNRLSFALHAFDASGVLRGVVELEGARYLNSATVNYETETVTWVGQSDRAVTRAWAELPAIR